ncbi:YwaF family protein [Candidatus Xianfuyuplasma coldseepsis]|uniref:YwaF family protein n=1 Tax=Candidatus Xianfuyuplasma coldseepsis TaxID=2782163 RepID=A0A7L7KNY1_9MOLU|nr:YwaF family protein [Xianfuyuplasma coldseepsis]QMS84235.1 YwaF family protein [Xianfuyuplasma coldseepsis]
MLDIFSFVYFVWSFSAIASVVGLYFAFRHRSAQFQWRLLFSFTIFAWVLHFSRIWLDPDVTTRMIFFEDLCGFNTMLFPFLITSKNRVSKDIMFFVAALFASHSLFYPNNIEGDPILYFNTIRFFFAHLILVAVPVLMVSWKLHKPSIKSYPYLIAYISVGALYNFYLSNLLVRSGIENRYYNYMGIWGGFDTVYRVFENVAPFLRYTTTVLGEEVSRPIPVIYLYPGLILYYTPVWFLMSFPTWVPWIRKWRTKKAQ